MARIMIIAGGEWQVPLVKKAKELGHYVLCTNLYKNSPAFYYSDENEVADVLDKDKNLKIALKFKPDVVITDQSDIAVPTVAYINEELGLKGIGVDKALLFTNKFFMREFEKKNGFSHPFFYCCEKIEDVQYALKNESALFSIIKPVDSQSSRGVFFIKTNENIENKFKQAKDASPSKKVILEEYIDGVEFTIDGLKINNEYFTLAISRKKHFSHNHQIASDLFFSWEDDEYNYKDLESVNSEHIKKSKLPFGLTHSEYKFYKGQFYLIEMAARGGGTLISSDIAPFMSGVDGPKELLNFLTDKKITITENKKSKAALLHFFDFPKGKVKKIKGEDEVKKIEGVHKFHLDFVEGDSICPPDNDRGRLGYIIIFGTSKKEVMNKLSLVNNTLDVEIEV